MLEAVHGILGNTAISPAYPTFVRLHNQRVSAGDRRRGDYRHDPRAASADDARQRRPRTLRRGPSEERSGEGRGALPRPARAWALLLFANAAATPTMGVWPLLLKTSTLDDGGADFCSSSRRPALRGHPRIGWRPWWTSPRAVGCCCSRRLSSGLGTPAELCAPTAQEGQNGRSQPHSRSGGTVRRAPVRTSASGTPAPRWR